MKKYLSIILISIALQSFAQPYVDIVQFRYYNGFHSFDKNSDVAPRIWTGAELPIKVSDNTYILFKPFYENWMFDTTTAHANNHTVHSIALPLGLIFPTGNNWTVTVIPTVRTNGEKLFSNDSYQFGGVAFGSYEKNPDRKLRIGIYVNTDFIGFFWRPLLGTNWKINDKNYLFGLLPGRLTWEHKLSEKFYTGITFRAITNSYRLMEGDYVRIEENQVNAFLDFYATDHICFTMEPGVGIFRQMRTGSEPKDYLVEENWGEGIIFKLTGAYRIRLN